MLFLPVTVVVLKMKPLYRDKDGVATSLSQAVYDKRIRLLSNLTSLLSFIGFGAAILAGEYTRENLRFRASLAASDLVKYRRLLWVSSILIDIPYSSHYFIDWICVASHVAELSQTVWQRFSADDIHHFIERLWIVGPSLRQHSFLQRK